ncbi:uncharacterized protein [Hetaerina americana]|uniref:uncharacterized protein n=1 Tax=Hetaerina americana TaxID=62018 RepID=UPI003A7F14E8
MMFGRLLRSRLTLLKPSVSKTVALRQRLLEMPQTRVTLLRRFRVGDEVWARAYGRGGSKDWVQATVTRVLGSRNYHVQTEQGHTWHRHIDQLRGRAKVAEGPHTVCDEVSSPEAVKTSVHTPMSVPPLVPVSSSNEDAELKTSVHTPMSVPPLVPVSSSNEDAEPVGYWESRKVDSTETVKNNVDGGQRRYPQRLRIPKKKWSV